MSIFILPSENVDMTICDCNSQRFVDLGIAQSKNRSKNLRRSDISGLTTLQRKSRRQDGKWLLSKSLGICDLEFHLPVREFQPHSGSSLPWG